MQLMNRTREGFDLIAAVLEVRRWRYESGMNTSLKAISNKTLAGTLAATFTATLLPGKESVGSGFPPAPPAARRWHHQCRCQVWDRRQQCQQHRLWLWVCLVDLWQGGTHGTYLAGKGRGWKPSQSSSLSNSLCTRDQATTRVPRELKGCQVPQREQYLWMSWEWQPDGLICDLEWQKLQHECA